MELLDRENARRLFAIYRKQRDGIRKRPELASICLICGSVNVAAKIGAPGMLACGNCGFPWYRYDCSACGRTVDGRDPRNPGCRECGWRICTCGACSCPIEGKRGEIV